MGMGERISEKRRGLLLVHSSSVGWGESRWSELYIVISTLQYPRLREGGSFGAMRTTRGSWVSFHPLILFSRR